MRSQIELDYTAKHLKIPYSKNKFLDSMFILPKILNEEDSELIKFNRLNQLDKKFTDQLNTSSFSMDRSGMFSMNKTMGFEENSDIDVNNLVIFCEPNGSFYEINCYNRVLLDFFTENGCCVLLWNYRGYGRSDGKPSLKVMFFILRRLEYCPRWENCVGVYENEA